MKLQKLLPYLAVLQAGVIAGLLIGPRAGEIASPAHAQIIPDPAAQQIQTNELLRGISARLDKLDERLAGELKVKVTNVPDRN